MRRIAAVFAALVLGSFALAAQATPITFTFTATNMNGTLNGVAFSNQTLTVTATADTTNVLDCGGGLLEYEAGCGGVAGTLSGSFSLGSSSGTFTNLLYVFAYHPGGLVGFGDATNNDLLDFAIPGAATYDMVSAFGPTSGTIDFDGQFNNDSTSLGALTAHGDGSVATFAAVLGGVQAVPEPAQLGLFGLGLLGLLGLALKRRA